MTPRMSGWNGPSAVRAKRKVRTTKPTTDFALAEAVGKVEVLLPAPLEADFPALWISESDAVQMLKTHDTSLPVGFSSPPDHGFVEFRLT